MTSSRIDIALPPGERMPAYLARPDGEPAAAFLQQHLGAAG